MISSCVANRRAPEQFRIDKQAPNALRSVRRLPLRRYPFNDAGWRRRWNNSRQLEASRTKQLSILSFGALAPSGHYKHIEVYQLAQGWLVAGWDYGFDKQQLAARSHCAAAVLENRNR